jgi:predicted DNA-binding ribbon-helix-helix protein
MHIHEFNSEKAPYRHRPSPDEHLEDDFWTSLQRIPHGRQVTRPDLIASLDAARGNSNLSSTIRVFILDHYRAMAGQSDVGFTATLSITSR